MPKLDIIIKAEEKGIRIPEIYKQSFQDLIAWCIKNRNGYMRVSLKPPMKKRTTGDKSQSHHLNGHITQLCYALNRDFEQVKKYIKYIAIENGYPMLRDQDNNPVMDLWGNYQGISETESSVEECAILIETCHIFAAKKSIELKEANDE